MLYWTEYNDETKLGEEFKDLYQAVYKHLSKSYTSMSGWADFMGLVTGMIFEMVSDLESDNHVVLLVGIFTRPDCFDETGANTCCTQCD